MEEGMNVLKYNGQIQVILIDPGWGDFRRACRKTATLAVGFACYSNGGAFVEK